MNSKSDSISKNIKTCAFPNCEYEGSKGLFLIPNDSRREKWLQASKLEESDVSKRSVFCFNHFRPDEIYGGEKIRRLRPWAVPCSSQQIEVNISAKTNQVILFEICLER